MCVSLPRARGDNFVVYVTDVFILNRASRGYDIINVTRHAKRDELGVI